MNLFSKRMRLMTTQSQLQLESKMESIVQKRLTYGCYQNVLKEAFLVL